MHLASGLTQQQRDMIMSPTKARENNVYQILERVFHILPVGLHCIGSVNGGSDSNVGQRVVT